MREVGIPCQGRFYCVGKKRSNVHWLDDVVSIPLFSTRTSGQMIFGQPVGWRSIIAELWEGEMIFFIGKEKTGRYWMVGYQDKIGYLKCENVIFFDPGEVG